MAEQKPPPAEKAEGPGRGYVGRSGILLVASYLILVTFLVLHGLVVLWPPNRESQEVDQLEETPAQQSAAASPAPAEEKAAGDPYCAKRDQRGQDKAVFLWFFTLCLSPEERLFLVVAFAGALGGLGHALRSIYWYIGNRTLVWSWLPMYVFLPIHGATLAIIFYLVIRGGFFSGQSTVSDTSPFGFAALAVLIGMFTPQAGEKLREIAETVLSKPPVGKNQAVPAPEIKSVDRTEGVLAGGEGVKITGTGFAKGAKVKFGGQPATDVVVAEDGKTITAITPPAQQPGQVPVEVINPDEQSDTFMGFTYQ